MSDQTRFGHHKPLRYSGEIVRVADPNYQATHCCGNKNQGVEIKEDIHYCITCGKGFQSPPLVKEVEGPHVITTEKMLATWEELGRQGLLNELNDL